MGIVFYVMWNWGNISTLMVGVTILTMPINIINFSGLAKKLLQPVYLWLKKRVDHYQI